MSFTVEKNGIPITISNSTLEKDEWWKTNYLSWEPFTFQVFDKFLTPNTIYIDLGTWSGPTILYASQKVKKAYGVELDPVAYKACLNNIQSTNLSNVTLEHVAISNVDGEVGVSEALGSSGCRIGPSNTTRVKSLTMESLVKKWGLSKCDFVKMDIKGDRDWET